MFGRERECVCEREGERGSVCVFALPLVILDTNPGSATRIWMSPTQIPLMSCC